MSARDDVRIGSTVFVFDINSRVYPKGGGAGAGPIWREHFRPCKVIGETSRSWILDYYDRKIPKRGDVHGVAFSKAEVDRAAWVHDHAHKIARLVEQSKNFDELRWVAKAIGYPVPLPAAESEDD